MQRYTLLACTLLGLTGLSQSQSNAADLPHAQPKVLTIYREHVKVGKAAEHAKFEQGYPAAFEKAKDPSQYLALSSITGPDEVWYLQPNDSFAQVGDGLKLRDKNPVL